MLDRGCQMSQSMRNVTRTVLVAIVIMWVGWVSTAIPMLSKDVAINQTQFGFIAEQLKNIDDKLDSHMTTGKVYCQ